MISLNKSSNFILIIILILALLTFTYSIVETNNQFGPIFALFEGI